jgi:hypothetical protein
MSNVLLILINLAVVSNNKCHGSIRSFVICIADNMCHGSIKSFDICIADSMCHESIKSFVILCLENDIFIGLFSFFYMEYMIFECVFFIYIIANLSRSIP